MLFCVPRAIRSQTEAIVVTSREEWWRRRESNPRPRKIAVKSLRVYPILDFNCRLRTGKIAAIQFDWISAYNSEQKPWAYLAI